MPASSPKSCSWFILAELQVFSIWFSLWNCNCFIVLFLPVCRFLGMILFLAMMESHELFYLYLICDICDLNIHFICIWRHLNKAMNKFYIVYVFALFFHELEARMLNVEASKEKLSSIWRAGLVQAVESYRLWPEGPRFESRYSCESWTAKLHSALLHIYLWTNHKPNFVWKIRQAEIHG